jgi:hypothetical protein
MALRQVRPIQITWRIGAGSQLIQDGIHAQAGYSLLRSFTLLRQLFKSGTYKNSQTLIGCANHRRTWKPVIGALQNDPLFLIKLAAV